MNYIKQLELDNERLRNKINLMDNILHEMYNYLESDKFKGIDGASNNYVNIDDIKHMIVNAMPFRTQNNEV